MSLGTGILIAVLGLFCFHLLLYLLMMQRQMIRLRQFIETLQEGDTSIMVPIDFQTKEVGKLIDEINLLVDQYRKNISELRRKDETIKETITNQEVFLRRT